MPTFSPHYSSTCKCRNCNAVRADAARIEREELADLLRHQEATGEERRPGQEEQEEALFTCDRCGRSFEDGIDAGHHEMWHARKDEGAKVAELLGALPVGTEFTLAGAGRAYSATYRQNSEGLWDQVYAIEAPLVRNMEAAHLGFCVGFETVAGAVARTVRA